MKKSKRRYLAKDDKVNIQPPSSFSIAISQQQILELPLCATVDSFQPSPLHFRRSTRQTIVKSEPSQRKYVDLKHTVVVEEAEGETEENISKKEGEEYENHIIVKDGENENEEVSASAVAYRSLQHTQTFYFFSTNSYSSYKTRKIPKRRRTKSTSLRSSRTMAKLTMTTMSKSQDHQRSHLAKLYEVIHCTHAPTATIQRQSAICSHDT